MARTGAIVLMACLCMVGAGCSKKQPKLLIQLPAGFTGQVRIDMGVPGAPPLQKDGGNYRVAIPPDGKVETSTIVENAGAAFENVETRRVWGYSQSMVRTGDRLTVGGNIDFFIGSKEQFEGAQANKHKSDLLERVATLG